MSIPSAPYLNAELVRFKEITENCKSLGQKLNSRKSQSYWKCSD